MSISDIRSLNNSIIIEEFKSTPYDVDYILSMSTGKTISESGATISKKSMVDSFLATLAYYNFKWTNTLYEDTIDKYNFQYAYFMDSLSENRINEYKSMEIKNNIIEEKLSHSNISKMNGWDKEKDKEYSDKFPFFVPDIDTYKEKLSIFSVATMRMNKRIYPASMPSIGDRITSMI